jgi:hypothetical protein
MRVSFGSLRRIFLPLLALAARPALAQNLLVNPGFDRDLGGWTAATTIFPDPNPFPGYVEASLGWAANDASASAASGGVALHAKANTFSAARAALTQCAPALEGMLISFGAKVLTVRQYATAQAAATVSFFSSADCSGTASGSATTSQPFVIPGGPVETNSGGLWLPVTSQAVASAGARSVLFEIGVSATGTSFYGLSYVDAVADDAVLTAAPATLTTSLLPSAGWVHGAAGAYWRTGLTLVNPGAADAPVTLKFLPHDADASAARDFSFVVQAGVTLPGVETNLKANFEENYGAILMTSSSPSVFLESETSTYVPGGGTVGQALPALGPADFVGATPKTLAPIRENAAFRTNLVLANATEAPLVAHVALFDADGTLLGSRDVDLPPLGMTQLNRVAAALGALTLDLGRIAISTLTPGGLVAAYASVIDNATNDPRMLLPRDTPGGPSAANLLVNPGFDRDLSGWDLRTYVDWGDPGASAAWVATDALSGNSGSVRFRLKAYGPSVNRVFLSQCVAAVPGRGYTGGGLLRTDSQIQFGVIARLELYSSAGCAGNPVAVADGYSLSPALHGPHDSQGRWLPVSASAVAGAGVQSLRFSAGIDAFTGSYDPFSSFDGLFDDAFLFEKTDPAAAWILPSSAKVSGAAGSSWTTTLTLANAGADDALVTLRFLGHDGGGRSFDEESLTVRTGTVVDLPDVLGTLFWRIQDFGAIRIATSSESVAVQSETSTPSSSGTVGQALPAFGPADFAGVAPKTLAPIRENAAFRTNLVLANATEAPLVAHVALFDADGTLLGSRDVDLPPLGMTQLNRVAAALGALTLDLGRIAISTLTPGGLVAAYASVIDNATNDPRMLLPR